MSDERVPTETAKEFREISLTQGQVALVDAADFDWINQWKWCASRDVETGKFYAVRNYRINCKQYRVIMARLIMGATPGVLVDHRNRDTLNNQRHNLRAATRSQNAQNQRPHRDNLTGFKGVSKSRNRFKAVFRIGRKYLHLGMFDTAEQAGEAYKQAANEHAGEFARWTA